MRDQAAAQDALAVLAAGVDTQGPADHAAACDFVDVAVQAEQGLVGLDRPSRTDTLPAPYRIGWPAATIWRRRVGASSSIGQVSSVESFGGAWKLKMTSGVVGQVGRRRVDRVVELRPLASRGVCQGVGLTYGMLTIMWPSSRWTARPSQAMKPAVPAAPSPP